MSTTLPFDTVEFGDEIGPVNWVPTTDRVRRYAAAAGVTDRRFIDPERARQVGFARPIVPGPLSASFLAKVLKNHFVGWRLTMLNTSFRTPVAHGDMLSCWGMVTEKKLADGVGCVDCDVVIENQHGDRVLVGTAMLSCRVQT